jgi:two-component system sensor histidine kinase SenX3
MAHAASIALDLRAITSEAVERALERNHLLPEAITLDLPAQALLVNGSTHDLHTAVGNLLGNAIKYSPDGVSISVRAYANEYDQACLEVSDQGIGIPASELKLIFKRFYRAPMRAVMRRQGTGLGLFLVRSIVKQHGGSVTAASKGEGLGATFSLRLPLLREGLAAQQELPLHKADA